jgi:hypothetical protein
VKNPVSGNGKILNWNNTYRGDNWINGVNEKYTQYSASWSFNSQEGLADNYLIYKEVEVFDNKSINLSEVASWQKNDPACKLNSYWVGNRENVYYICNWNMFDNQQDLKNNYQSNNRQIFYYNENVIVRMYLYWGYKLTDIQVQKLSQQKIGDLINSLQNNQYKSVDWSNFDIPWPVGKELEAVFSGCESKIAINPDANFRSWECKTEPVICPEHGFQTRVCRAWNPETKEDDIQTNHISCSPGICSGCYVSKWFNLGSENKCIPYGFRFINERGDKGKIYESDINNEGSGNSPLKLTINSDNTAKIETIKPYEGSDKISIEIYGYGTYNLSVGESFIVQPYTTYIGKIIEERMSGEIREEEMTIAVQNIFYSTESGKSYISIVFKDDYPAYCDIDGWVKQQKTKEGSEWAKCQNNYECESNICSYGECVDLKGIADQVNVFKGTFVKVVCKLSNLFDIDDYNTCVWKYFGEEESKTASSSSGGSGGGSSGGSSPPSMPN